MASPEPRAPNDGAATAGRDPLSGRPLVYAARPTIAHATRACSVRTPLCVHASDAVPGDVLLTVLSAGDHAFETLTGALALPAPDVDPDSLAYDLFVAEDGARSATHLAARDVRSNVDRARGFSVLDVRDLQGCELDRTVARALAMASLLRVAPATDEGSALAQATYLAGLVAPCSSLAQRDEVRAFQRHPERAVASRHAGDAPALVAAWQEPMRRQAHDHAAGAALFWGYIDASYGISPGSIVRAVWALTPTVTPPLAERWANEPDGFDVLRTTFDGALFTGSKLADLLLDAAIARAFVGRADDRNPTQPTTSLGDAGRVAHDWDLAWPSSPRRVAPRAPVEPTGSSYVTIGLGKAPRDARLRIELTWEQHALFRWAVVKLDAQGAELGRLTIPTTERATDAQLTVADFGAATTLLLVGVNVGDPAYAFDPDDEVWEPHGWLATVAAE